jgi:endonuclease/exonuclease/phosphatase family metal-dependent hydrolase
VTDQPALAAALGDAAVLRREPESQRGLARQRHQYGTLILSKFDILECRNTFLPSTRPATPTSPAVNREQRGLLEALVNVRGVPLRFYDTHYEHTSDFSDVRAAQIIATIALIGDFEEDTIPGGRSERAADRRRDPAALRGLQGHVADRQPGRAGHGSRRRRRPNRRAASITCCSRPT